MLINWYVHCLSSVPIRNHSEWPGSDSLCTGVSTMLSNCGRTRNTQLSVYRSSSLHKLSQPPFGASIAEAGSTVPMGNARARTCSHVGASFVTSTVHSLFSSKYKGITVLDSESFFFVVGIAQRTSDQVGSKSFGGHSEDASATFGLL